MAMETLLQRILTEPTADDLWALHPHLLVHPAPEATLAREIAQCFYCYLSCVRSKLTSKQYSHLSALLAAGSVSVIAAQDILEGLRTGRQQALGNLLAGGLAAALETTSTRQHVRAWETEFASVHEEAVWHLYTGLWLLSVETQPELALEQRHALIDSLLGVVRNPEADSAGRMAIIIHLFQVLLALRMAPLLGVAANPPTA